MAFQSFADARVADDGAVFEAYLGLLHKLALFVQVGHLSSIALLVD